MSAAVSLQNVVKHYRRGKESVEVLHGLSLDIPEGQFVSLMGPSGSGKTTILNLIGGLDHADSGEIVVGGDIWKACRAVSSPAGAPGISVSSSSSII